MYLSETKQIHVIDWQAFKEAVGHNNNNYTAFVVRKFHVDVLKCVDSRRKS